MALAFADGCKPPCIKARVLDAAEVVLGTADANEIGRGLDQRFARLESAGGV